MALFICHEDFECEAPLPIYFKEKDFLQRRESDERFLNRHILFRKKAVLESTENAILKITADDHYKLYINGSFVTEGPAPSYPECCYYNEIDVGEYLRKGENTFAVHTYYQGLINRVWVSGDRRSSLYFSLSLSGEEVVGSDESFLVSDHTGFDKLHLIGYDTAFTEIYNSASAEADFYKEDFDDSAWKNAKIYKFANYVLQKQPTKQLVYERIDPIISENRGGKLFLDFGKEAVGYLCARARGNRGDELVLHFSEELGDDGSVRYSLRANCLYEDKWLLSGGEDTLDQYDYKAFRYAEIIYPDGVTLSDVHMLARYYPYEEKAIYETNNEKLKRILRLCADTVKYGTQEQFVDCPTREKGQYLGDVSIAGRAHAVVNADTAMMKKALRDFFATSRVCPGLLAVSTSSFMQEIADYSLQTAASVLWVYRTDGDIAFLREGLPYLEGIYGYFLKYTEEDGLISGVGEKWNLVDWPAGLRDGYSFPLPKPVGEGAHNVLNAFWYGFLSDMEAIYSELGIEKELGRADVGRAFISAFYNEQTGLFCDDRTKLHSAVHSNILPLLFGIGTEDEALKGRLIDLIRKKRLTSVGVYMAYFALAALQRCGEGELAEELTCDEGAWLLMLKEGATTTFEAWGKEQKGNASLFHPWAVAPLIIFAKGVIPY